MLLGEILHDGVVKIGLEAENKFEAIEELVDVLIESHEIPISKRDHIVECVVQREKSMSTGMEHGVALPHGSSDRVNDIVGVLGIAPKGIAFESLDGLPAKIVILLILPRQKFQAHVRTLAGIAHLMSNPEFRDALVATESVDSVLDLIEHEEDKDVFQEFSLDE
jgi:mannitol/fructose-specific phosphotransferase system IIA component (Ntr-type)